MHARPRPGEFIDVLATPDGVVAVRREQASANAFVEVGDGDRLRWRGVAGYAGRPWRARGRGVGALGDGAGGAAPGSRLGVRVRRRHRQEGDSGAGLVDAQAT
ncbi:MAG: hypothetical protein HS111_17365 [Kofleriaceae bacterium]|nr:hypothetical protein [Kofleriaceae bacterium]